MDRPHRVLSDGFTLHGNEYQQGEIVPHVPENMAELFANELEPTEAENEAQPGILNRVRGLFS